MLVSTHQTRQHLNDMHVSRLDGDAYETVVESDAESSRSQPIGNQSQSDRPMRFLKLSSQKLNVNSDTSLEGGLKTLTPTQGEAEVM